MLVQASFLTCMTVSLQVYQTVSKLCIIFRLASAMFLSRETSIPCSRNPCWTLLVLYRCRKLHLHAKRAALTRIQSSRTVSCNSCECRVKDVKDVACVEELLSRSKVFRDTHEECLGSTQKLAHVVTVDTRISCHPGTILVPSWYHPGTILVPSWYHPATIVKFLPGASSILKFLQFPR